MVHDARTDTADRRGRDAVAVLVPVLRQRRDGAQTVGAYVLTSRGVRYRPALGARHVTTMVGLCCATAAAVAVALASQRAQVGPVTMGPGGWVSVRGGTRMPGLRASRGRPRPWWAHLLQARRLVVER